MLSKKFRNFIFFVIVFTSCNNVEDVFRIIKNSSRISKSLNENKFKSLDNKKSRTSIITITNIDTIKNNNAQYLFELNVHNDSKKMIKNAISTLPYMANNYFENGTDVFINVYIDTIFANSYLVHYNKTANYYFNYKILCNQPYKVE